MKMILLFTIQKLMKLMQATILVKSREGESKEIINILFLVCSLLSEIW